MIPVYLNFSEIGKSFDLSSTEIDLIIKKALQDVTLTVLDAWIAEANNSLNSTKKNYINSLRIIEEGKFTNVIMLFGELNNMIEFGIPPYDMKIGFSQSSKRKISKKGKWYLSIPFSHKASDLPDEVYDILQKDNVTTESNLPDKFKTTSTRERLMILNKPVEEYKRKTSIFMGINKVQHTYENTTQSMYVSFRRVGENSDPNSWIHSGIQAHDLASKALSNLNLDELANNSVNNSLINIGF